MQPNPPPDWFTSILQGVAGNAVWGILLAAFGVIVTVLKKRRSEWLSPVLYGLIGAVLFGVLIYAPAFHARWPLATPLVLVGTLVVAAGLHLASVFIERHRTETDSSISVPISPTQTRLKLQFNAGNALPVAIEYLNIYRWHELHWDEITPRLDGTELNRRKVLTSIFVLFDSPIIIRQFRVDSGGAALPPFEVKDQSDRHAVLAFQGALENLVLDIEAIHV